MKNTLIHAFGPSPCNKIAFFYDGLVAIGAKVQSKYVTYPDGSKPKPHDAAYCGSCGNPISLSHLTVGDSLLSDLENNGKMN